MTSAGTVSHQAFELLNANPSTSQNNWLNESPLSTTLSKSILVIDSDVKDYQSLIANVQLDAEVHVLDPTRDAIAQITDILMGRSGIESLQIISHGQSGSLKLGESWLDATALNAYATQLQSWAAALNPDADILLYGCNVAQDAIGKAFVNAIAQLTGADVAASEDITGNGAMGGNWELEYRLGVINDRFNTTADWQKSYQAILAVGIQSVNDSYTLAQNTTLQTAFASSTLVMDGDAGDYVSQGKTYSFDLTQGNFSGARTYPSNLSSNNGIKINYDELWSGGKNWSLNFAAPSNQPLVAGQTYLGATRFPFQVVTVPGLDVSGEGRGNNALTGQFTINAVDYGVGDQITSLDATFEQRSTSTPAAAFRGRIRYGMTTGNRPAGVLKNDVKTADYNATTGAGTITAKLVSGVSNGQLTFNSDGSFSYTPNLNFIGNDTFTYQALLNGQASTPSTVTLKVLGNQSPQLTIASSAITYIENAPALLLDSSATLTDDNNNFNTGTLTVRFSNNGTGADRLAIRNEGTGATQINLNGNQINYGSTLIGTFTGGLGTTDLVITFNASATPTSAQALLRNLTYFNSSDSPSTSDRTIQFVLTDGTGGTSTAVTRIVKLTAINDAPSFTGNATLPAVNEDSATPTGDLISNLFLNQFSDPDAGAALGGIAIVGNPANAVTEGKWQYSINGTVWSDVGTVNDGANALALNATTRLRFLAAANYSGIPSTLVVRALDNNQTAYTNGTGSITVDTTTRGGSTAIAATTNTISTSITSVNDAPSFTKGSDQTTTPGSGTQTIANWATTFNPGGGADEAAQTATYEIVSNSNPSLFSTAPAIAPNGTLTYTPGTTTGTATLTVRVKDNGGMANGGVDTSATQSFTITVSSQTISLTATDATATEVAGDTGTYRISRDKSGGSRTIAVAISGSATAADYNFSLAAASVTAGATLNVSGNSLNLTLPDGVLSADLIVTPVDDIQAEAAETIQLDLSASATYTLGTAKTGIVTIAQNDFVVTNINDAGEGSLRQAILNANAIAGDDLITFAGTVLTDATRDTLTLTSGELSISSNLTIKGTAANLITISGNNTSRAFRVNSGSIVTLSGLTISNGNAANSTIKNGGGILNDGTLTVINSTLSGNSASSGGGGGIASSSNSTLTVINSTISGNSANLGGGIFREGAIATLTSSTLSGNSSSDGGGILSKGTGKITVSNTIVAGNTSSNGLAGGEISNLEVTATVESGGYNLFGFNNKSGLIGVPTTATDIIPKVALSAILNPVLANNGGTTQTHELVVGSPATNAGNSALLPTDKTDLDNDANTTEPLPLDQRGQVRIQDTKLDIGAVERQTSSITISTPTAIAEGTGTPTASVSTPVTFVVSLSAANPTNTVTVQYTTVDDTATTLDNDYTAAAGTLSFAPGETAKTITVNVKGDDKYEQIETFKLNLSNATNAAIATASATATINNDDNKPTVGITNITKAEGNSLTTAFAFEVTLSNPSYEAIVVNYSTADGTAQVNTDYLQASGSLTFQSGQALTQTITVNVKGDKTYEPDEIFSLNLSTPSQATLAKSSVTGTIQNDDVSANVLWRNYRTGQIALWDIADTTFSGSVLLPTVADTNWVIEVAEDFDGDGDTDLLWRNYQTGQVGTWTLDGKTLQFPTTLAWAPDLNWQIKGTADFNTDGKRDILWHNKATGQVAVWTLDGSNLKDGFILGTRADLNWVVEQVGDLTGDLKPDLLWRNKTTGATDIWQLGTLVGLVTKAPGDTQPQIVTVPTTVNGTPFIQQRTLYGAVDLKWRIVNLKDFDNDGSLDIVWENTTSQDFGFWQLKAGVFQTSIVLPKLSSPSPFWSIAGIYDCNTDGNADLFLRNSSTGETMIWKFKGMTPDTQNSVYTVSDRDWTIEGINRFA